MDGYIYHTILIIIGIFILLYKKDKTTIFPKAVGSTFGLTSEHPEPWQAPGG